MGMHVDEARLPQQATVADLESVLATAEQVAPPVEFPGWPFRLPTRVVRFLLQRLVMEPLLAVLCPLRVRGLENLGDLSGPVLFAANHSSHLDAPMMLRVLGKRYSWRLAVAAAADYWFTNPLLGVFTVLLFNSFPMARRGNVRPSMEHTIDLIDEGWSVLIYPEGTRSLTGKMQTFRPGVGLLAAELGVPVVPIHLGGLFQVLPKGAHFPRRGPVEVSIGGPLHFSPGMDHTEAARQLEGEIRKLAGLSA